MKKQWTVLSEQSRPGVPALTRPPLVLPSDESEQLRAEFQLGQASLCLVSPSERSRKQRAAHGTALALV